MTVTGFWPGPTETELHRRADMEGSRPEREEAARFTGAETVAAKGYRSLGSNRTVVGSGLKNKLGIFAMWIAPLGLVPPMVRFGAREAGKRLIERDSRQGVPETGRLPGFIGGSPPAPGERTRPQSAGLQHAEPRGLTVLAG